MSERVLVAMSGGVDSSVAALILKEQGYDVVGVTFQLYDYSRSNRREGKGGCCSLEDVTDARLVCRKIGIQHFLFDSRERFMSRVVSYFSDSYKRGLTPNPCMACNTFIKFDELEYYAKAVDASKFATGHYVKTVQYCGKTFLERADDPAKDQSYFLMGVAPELLEKAIFPIGHLTKDEVRAMAEKAGLPVSQKPDSMEICFVPENNYRKFLLEEGGIGDDPGEIVDRTGQIVGRHRGIHHFTVGQKKGLGDLGLQHYYVLELNAEKKQVIVGEDRALFSDGFNFEVLRFDSIEGYLNKPLTVKIRSRSPYIPCKIIGVSDKLATVLFDEPQRAVTPGQFSVFYDANRLVGGGPIARAVANFGDESRRPSETIGHSVLRSQAS